MKTDTSHETENFQRTVRDFWESRGAASPHTDARLTMLSEHARYTDYVHRQEMRYLDPWITKLGRPHVLDVGCGYGRLAFALAERCRAIVGLDGSSSLIKLATERAQREGVKNVSFSVRDVLEPYREGQFDLVVCSGLFSCLTDEQSRGGLQWMLDALIPGGLLYIRNNVSNGERFERRTSSPAVYRNGEEYKRLVSEQGFEILDERYLFAPLCAPNVAYYHVIPKALRDREPASTLLDVWFELEAKTSEARLKWLGDVYPYLLRALGKPTSFRVIVARRPLS